MADQFALIMAGLDNLQAGQDGMKAELKAELQNIREAVLQLAKQQKNQSKEKP